MPKIEVSFGEIFDKLSILEIKKKDKLIGQDQLVNIHTEINTIRNSWDSFDRQLAKIKPLYTMLKYINKVIWDMNDAIRYDNAHVYYTIVMIENDARFRVKTMINTFLDSQVKEEKNITKKSSITLCSIGVPFQQTVMSVFYSVLYHDTVHLYYEPLSKPLLDAALATVQPQINYIEFHQPTDTLHGCVHVDLPLSFVEMFESDQCHDQP